MAETEPQWLTLTAASRMLGVHPMTLRSWVDAGLINAFRTPGGHRRIRTSDLGEFLSRRSGEQPRSALTITPSQTLQQVRQQLQAESGARPQWYVRLSDSERARQRELGRRLLGLLLQFISHRKNPEEFLDQGRNLAQEYGRDLAQSGLSAAELARAFLFFRRTVLDAAFNANGSRSPGDPEGVRLLQAINSFMDELLISTLEAYEKVRNRQNS